MVTKQYMAKECHNNPQQTKNIYNRIFRIFALCHSSDVTCIHSITCEIGSQSLLCIVSCAMDFGFLIVPFLVPTAAISLTEEYLNIKHLFIWWISVAKIITFDILAPVDQLLQIPALWTMINVHAVTTQKKKCCVGHRTVIYIVKM